MRLEVLEVALLKPTRLCRPMPSRAGVFAFGLELPADTAPGSSGELRIWQPAPRPQLLTLAFSDQECDFYDVRVSSAFLFRWSSSSEDLLPPKEESSRDEGTVSRRLRPGIRYVLNVKTSDLRQGERAELCISRERPPLRPQALPRGRP